jgi:hypothetical protein
MVKMKRLNVIKDIHESRIKEFEKMGFKKYGEPIKATKPIEVPKPAKSVKEKAEPV